MAAPQIVADWPAIREAAIAGVRLDRLATLHGVNFHTVRKRALRERWPLPCRIRAAAARLSQNVSKPLESADLATKTAAESLQELGEEGTLAGAKLLHGLLQRAAKRPGKLVPLKDASDVVTAMKGVRIAAGLDREGGVNVNLALFGAGGSGSDGFEV